MIKPLFRLFVVLGALGLHGSAFAASAPKVVAFYTVDVESDHIHFAQDALKFFAAHAKQDGYDFVSTTRWGDLNAGYLANCRVVIWLDDEPHTPAQEQAFQKYMTSGGAWLGFHVVGYTEKKTTWPWYQSFLGGIFYGNSWPPIPADLEVNDPHHPVTSGLPLTFEAPTNEWYSWNPNPATNKDVKVLLSLAPSNFPIGIKDVLTSGPVPVVWTNTKYKMLYINMGHGDKIFTSPIQNHLIENGLLWLMGKGPGDSTPGAGLPR
jgi:type 1 glutamine amidotransferase